jgi:DNA repair photolyase
MIKEITAKSLLSHSKSADPWFGIQYNMNLYRGCSHQCIYCDSRSECYQIENFADTLVKINALELLQRELAGKRIKGTIGTGSMNDPYAPIEQKYQLTRGALEIIAGYGFPVHVLTKSDLVCRDADLLLEIQKRSFALVSFTITTCDDALGKKVEPRAPLVSRRLAAMKALADRGVRVGVSLMPVLPFIEDNWENIRQIVYLARENGAGHILAAFGMTQRKGQQEYYYRKLDELFPGVREKHQRRFGNQYECSANHANELRSQFLRLCEQVGMETKAPTYKPREPARQLGFFEG